MMQNPYLFSVRCSECLRGVDHSQEVHDALRSLPENQGDIHLTRAFLNGLAFSAAFGGAFWGLAEIARLFQ
jgi:hypothetical protein